MKKKKWVIVIDGPSGAGKSTVCQKLAKKLSYLYLDTGALYRCVALLVQKHELPPKNSKKLYELVAQSKIHFQKGKTVQQVILNGKNVTKLIRTSQVSLLASRYSKLKSVRKALLQKQRDVAKEGGIVAEGRDLGTVVFPNAELKFFMEASVKERARRRYLELHAKGEKVTLKEVETQIRDRDLSDERRTLSPLRKASDAIAIDTTRLTVDRVTEQLYKTFKKKYEHSH